MPKLQWRAAMLLVPVLAAGCSSDAGPPVDATTHQFKFANCPTPLSVTIPNEFVRAPSVEVEAKKGCHYGTYSDKGRTYECLFIDWNPELQSRRVQVQARANLVHAYEPGNLSVETWRSIRSSVGGHSSLGRDTRFADAIRRMEPSAPENTRSLRQRFPQFFNDSTDVATSLTESYSSDGRALFGGRYYFTQGCIVSVEYRIEYPSHEPASTLNGYLARTAVR